MPSFATDDCYFRVLRRSVNDIAQGAWRICRTRVSDLPGALATDSAVRGKRDARFECRVRQKQRKHPGGPYPAVSVSRAVPSRMPSVGLSLVAILGRAPSPHMRTRGGGVQTVFLSFGWLRPMGPRVPADAVAGMLANGALEASAGRPADMPGRHADSPDRHFQ